MDLSKKKTPVLKPTIVTREEKPASGKQKRISKQLLASMTEHLGRKRLQQLNELSEGKKFAAIFESLMESEDELELTKCMVEVMKHLIDIRAKIAVSKAELVVLEDRLQHTDPSFTIAISSDCTDGEASTTE